MATLQIDEAKAKSLYPKANKALKKMLEESFGKEFFITKKDITQRIKTFEDACRELKIKTHADAFKLLKLKRSISGDISISKCDDGVLRVMIIAKALNEGWIPDFSDVNQYKWYPYFKWFSSGFAFSGAGYVDWVTRTDGGSRLCFKSENLAKYAGQQFVSEYKKFM